MPIKVLFYTAVEGELGILAAALASLRQEFGPLIEARAYAKREVSDPGGEEELVSAAAECHFLLLRTMGGMESLPGSRRLAALARERDIPLAIIPSAGEEGEEQRQLSHLSDEDYRLVRLYVSYGGRNNYRHLLLWAASRFGGLVLPFEEPRPLPWEGFYHPSYPGTEVTEYLAARLGEGKPVVGILFYQSCWVAGNIGFVDELIRQVEEQGGVALPVFLYTTRNDELGSRGIAWVVENYFCRNGCPVVDVVLNTLMFAQTMATPTFGRVEEKDLYHRLGVPVIKAILSLSPRQEWEESLQGLGPLDVVMSVALPEFDGDLITVPVATREEGERDPLTGAGLVRYEPIAERAQKVASLALRWAVLRRKPNREKKVAIILHNYPPRNDRIGNAFGLDTPESVHRLLVKMREAGYLVENLPSSGAELMERVLSGLTNERGWLEPRELERRAVAWVEGGTYREWFDSFPARAREHLKRDWGEPPGEVFVYGRKLLIPGIFLGNVFLGIQPPRGFLEDPAKIYHSPDLSPPHHYLSFYRWLREEFKADVVFHIGKHGSLEWLPGKGVGLSPSCSPDLALLDLPHVYPYIINNPGEGTQAKRRSHACVVDHLVPVMTRAGTYEELAELEPLFKEYHEVKAMDPSKLPLLRQQIWEKAAFIKLDSDLNITREEAEKDWDGFIERLHDYVYEIKDTLIRDGLHILGQPPQGEALVEMVLSLTRLANGPVPSLRECLARALGYDYHHLISSPGRFDPVAGCTYGEVLEKIEQVSRGLIRNFAETDYDPAQACAVVESTLGKGDEEVSRVLHYVGHSLVPALKATVQELDNCLLALAGGFVLPGPSGAPTRGMADILPTGRNFYSVDPQAVPSRAAWEVGKTLAEALLLRYKEERGTYPRSVGLVVWATANMRTGGEDVAQALYLLGVRPVWEERSGRVKGLEVIPLEKLGRPRIDITIRASGMFRDAFFNVIQLIDQAVEMVANLDEPDELNFVAAHVRAEVAEKLAAGMSFAEAREEALWRIFSDKPGCYGAGVSNLITAKNWKDGGDLAEAYLTWGGYAYSRRVYGREARHAFCRRLAAVEATVKNEDNREIDMYDSDDFYSYHGGMVAAVKVIKGEKPLSFSGDSSDPARVKVRTLEEETRHIFRARVLNPKWIESMKRHGYKGAGDLSHLVEVAFGWDATAEVLDDWLYEALAQKYALDSSIQEWFKKVNPWALKNIVEHLLEAIERGMWQAAPELSEALKELYLEIEAELEARTE